MYATATIEPRLIALLNDYLVDPYPPSRLDLPPLHDTTVQKAPGRPSPLEPQAGIRRDKPSSLTVQQTLSFDRDVNHGSSASTSGSHEGLKTTLTLDRALGATSPQSLRKILDDVSEIPQLPAPKKRQRTDSSKDEFVQLPQPPKKQKAAKQVVPPIIIGLFEPPPNAALFPPISSSAFHDSHGRNSLNVGPPIEAKNTVTHKVQAPSKEEPKAETTLPKKSNAQARKKWTETETTQMLLGVKKHGLGSWTKIIHDPEFRFNGRKALDLKDRFRTCCPEELRGSGNTGAQRIVDTDDLDPEGPKIKQTEPTISKVGEVGYASSEGSNADERINSEPGKLHKSKAHRKKVEDLVQLGIKEPFQKSKRRVRRPFSEEEDSNIVRGWEKYGASWTSIQKDPELGLGARRPTDVRDRLRNRFPDKFRIPGDISGEARDVSGTSSHITPVLHTHHSSQISDMTSGENRGLHIVQEPKTGAKQVAPLPPLALPMKDMFSDLLDQQTTSETSESLSFSQSFDWSDGTIAPFTSSLAEMDISRFLSDDDGWSTTLSESKHAKTKQSFTDISSIITSTGPSPNQFLGTYGMTSHETASTVNPPPT